MFIFVSTSHRKGDQPVGMNKKSRSQTDQKTIMCKFRSYGGDEIAGKYAQFQHLRK